MLETNYSIAVLSYNHPDLTAATVDSVLRSGFTPQKTYLIHNGSELKHQNILTAKFPQINHLILNENLGFSGGANFAFAEIFKTEERILFLTNDTEILHIKQEFPLDLDFFSISVLKRNSKNLDSIIGTVNLKTGHLAHVRSTADLQNLPQYIRTYIPGTAFGITKKTYVSVGGFDESFHTYWEDVDLSLRAHASIAGLRIGFDEGFQVKHKIGKTCHKHRFYTLYLFQRNRKWLLNKFGTAPLQFYFHFVLDMARLFFKVLKSENFKTDLNFWWKAVCD